MDDFVKSPFFVFLVSLAVLWLSVRLGASLRNRKPVDEDARKDLDLIVPATLTLLGLVIGFSFSMAINRYDQRKAYEEAEANAIGTEYLRADLLRPTMLSVYVCYSEITLINEFCFIKPAIIVP